MQKKKKVLFFTPSSVGGAERVTLTIAKMLPTDKYDVVVVIVDRELGDIVKFIPNRFGIKHLKVRNIWDFVTCRMVYLMRKERPYAVFSSLVYLNSRVIMAANIVGGIKIIVRNNIVFSRLRKDKRYLAYCSYSKVDRIIMQTDEMRDDFIRCVPIDIKKTIVIPNPIDVETIEQKLREAENPLPKNVINYVFVGRISHYKGLDALIPAFAQVKKQYAEAHLTIVGKTSKEDEYFIRLLNTVAMYKLDKSVTFTNFQDNPYKYIKYADCFVLPSRVEGMPNVLLDAMYLQTRVVATRSVDVIDRMVTTDRGIVVDVDDVKALAMAMTHVLSINRPAKYEHTSKDKFLNIFE